MEKVNIYKQLKNHIHNTLEISKEDIRSMVKQAIEDTVERKVDVLVRDKINLQHLIDETIALKITQNNWFWGESEDSLDDYIKKEMVRKLTDGIKLKVEVVGKKSETTKTGDMRMKIKKRK